MPTLRTSSKAPRPSPIPYIRSEPDDKLMGDKVLDHFRICDRQLIPSIQSLRFSLSTQATFDIIYHLDTQIAMLGIVVKLKLKRSNQCRRCLTNDNPFTHRDARNRSPKLAKWVSVKFQKTKLLDVTGSSSKHFLAFSDLPRMVEYCCDELLEAYTAHL